MLPVAGRTALPPPGGNEAQLVSASLADQSNARLFGALTRLEKRIFELEHTTHTSLTLTRRLRRLRTSETMRALVRETRLSPDALILPLFVCEGEGVRREVPSMPGVFNVSVDEAVRETEAAKADGIRSVVDHPELLASMAEECRRLAPELSWPVVARRYEELATSLLVRERARA